MNLYGQAQLAKTLNDQKNIERNYWRIFRELEEAKKTIDGLQADNTKLQEEIKALKAKPSPVKTTVKKPAKKKAAEVTEENDLSNYDRTLD